MTKHLGVVAAAEAGDYLSLDLLWQDLLANRTCIASTFIVGDRCFTWVTAGHEEPARPGAARILERVLLGESQKVVAVELGLAPSSIASACREVLEIMSPCRRAARAPLLLVIAAHAACGAGPGTARVEAKEPGLRALLSTDLPLKPAALLSRSEGEVLRLVLQGSSHAEVASVRRTSQRTTANQLASLFRKLGISGVSELRSKLVREQARSTNAVLSGSRPRSRSRARPASTDSRPFEIDALASRG